MSVRMLTTKRQSLKQLHRTLILDLVRRKGRMSRKDIAVKTGIRPSTITTYVSELIQSGFLEEVGYGQAAIGRRPVLLDIRRDRRYVIGVSVADGEVSSVTKTLRGDDFGRPRRTLITPSSSQEVLDAAIGAARAQIVQLNRRGLIQGIGLATPGLVNRHQGVGVAYTHYPWWRQIPFKKAIGEAFGLPVHVENDVKSMALAEMWFGAAQGKKSLVFVYVGEGCGGAIIIDGRVYHGFAGSAGELGHATIDPNGPLCTCGSRGCLETVVSSQALIGYVLEALPDDDGPKSVLADEPVTVPRIAEAAGQGDEVACAAIARMAGYLGVGLSNVIRHLDPEAIIIGGDVAVLGEALLAPLREELAARSIAGTPVAAEVSLSQLGDTAAAAGAAALVLAEVYGDTL